MGINGIDMIRFANTQHNFKCDSILLMGDVYLVCPHKAYPSSKLIDANDYLFGLM